ncbi:hypothetical protein ACHAXR_010018 [Thalassiosira sp. AJA248-18]
MMANNESSSFGIRLSNAEEVYRRIKEHVRSSLRSLVLETLTTASNNDMNASESDSDEIILSEELHKEETGYLGVHIVLLPPSMSDTTSGGGGGIATLIPPSLHAHLRQHKRQIQQAAGRILNPRKRFRGNDPTLKQGGDPRSNLELRVRRGECRIGEEQGHHNGAKRRCLDTDKNIEGEKKIVANHELHEWNMIVSWLEKNTVLQWLEKASSLVGSKDGNDHSEELTTWFRQLRQSGNCPTQQSKNQHCSIHTAAWRRPFYIQGTYTKSRRDISQTPFYVPSTASSKPINDKSNNDATATNKNANTKPNAMVRKGVSSVEDEICPPIARIACGGISTQNNERPTPSNNNDSQQQVVVDGGEKGAVVYGLCKFHASGREDMDVRMLLPPPSIAEVSAKSDISITGRPFVCEVFDAHKMPSNSDLKKVVKTINCQEEETTAKSIASCVESMTKEVEMDEKGWPQTLVLPHRYHGSNPNGVGVSSPLKLVPSSAFSGLQSETEEKVKYYGCLCWTSVAISSDEELVRKLGCSHWNEEGERDTTKKKASSCIIYPLEIKQSTPLRVLHRRSSDIRTRYILGLSACRIDEHWFRLRMSTSAGTYVKEFVHGDCGRSYPSIGSMLGGRTDITELDCEGIAV